MSSSTRTYLEYHSAPNERASSLIDLLRWRAQHQPELVAYTFLIDGEMQEERVTYSDLDAQARAVGAWLQSQEAENERVLLLYPPGLNYIAAFVGCLYAGATAVPAYPPRLNHSLSRLQSIIIDAGAKFALTDGPILSKVEKMFEMAPFLKRLRWLATDEVVREFTLSEEWREPSLSSDTIAFLQYTSGSTATPKGVMVSHGNLLQNERMIQWACEHTEDSTFGGWLPLYHDMGLIGNLLQPLFIGSRCILMSPIAFLQKPLRWLQAISRYRVATSGGPNFAYDLCVRKIGEEERATLDLSSWTTAFNGAEPVRYETMQRFASTFASCGFREEAFYPCYGLAEATLMVTGGYKSARPITCIVDRSALAQNQIVEAVVESAKTKTLVGTGRALLDEVIVIANPDTLTECYPGEIGEIWVAGENVAAGYWNRAEETEQTFHAFLLDSDQGPFLRTGDLGFLKDGELFVTGRLKDLIIIRGQNHYPQDIELTAERSHAALRLGCSAAFSVDVDGEERLVVVQELESHYSGDLSEVLEGMRQAVVVAHEVEPYALVLVKQGSILKTSSGKIQRRACRAAFLDASLATVGEWRVADTSEIIVPDATLLMAAPKNPEDIEVWLAAELAAKLGISSQQIDLQRPVAQFGLDSLLAVELAQSIESKLGVVLSVTSFLQDHSISQLALRLAEQLADSLDVHAAALARSTELTPGEGRSETTIESPLSSNQEALWFLHELAPESTAYSIVKAARIRSQLDVKALRRAAQALVDRHGSLRTTFNVADRHPVQRIHRYMEVSFEEVNACEWTDAILQKQLVEDAQLPFDLEHGPLLRLKLFSRPGDEYILLLSVHHIVTDFWSMAVLMRELGALYEAELNGSSASLPSLSVDYSDHVKWQAELLAGKRGEKLAAYWEKELAGDLPVLELPIDHPRPPVQTYRGSSYSFTVSAELADRIKKLAREQDATLYMTLLAVFQALLYRYTGHAEILVGSPAASRSKPEFAGVVGYFVNPLVLRANCAGDPTFSEFLAGVRQTVLGALEHQEYPFPLLVERLQPKRDMSRSPLFQTMFVLQKSHLPGEEGLALFALGDGRAQLRLKSLELESVTLEQQVAQFDLTLMMTDAAGELHGSFEYNRDLFDESTIARFAEHLAVLFEGIVANPAQRLSTYSLLTSAEQHQVITEWNQTARDFDLTQCLHELFEEQVKTTPEAVALIFEEESLTYRELNARANQLAHHLRERGVGPDVLVGVLLDRSMEMVVSLLGILKSGGAYLPLDPSYPRERLLFMLSDAQPARVLTNKHGREVLGEIALEIVHIDTEWDQIAACSVESPRIDSAGENLAYVIYTSGSTGRPKGVMGLHRSSINRFRWMWEAYPFTDRDVCCQKTALSFVDSVWEIFGPLLRGVPLVIIPQDDVKDPQRLVATLREHKVTRIVLVPSLLQLLLESDIALNEKLPQLKYWVCSGEALTKELSERFAEKLPRRMLLNLYGSSEVAADVTCQQVNTGSGTERVPLGKPIANTQVYILDQQMRPVPLGVSGELYVAGDNLSRGYLHNAPLTAEKFLPCECAPVAGARMYRTGDRARWLPCGNIEYQGRLDQQVKIRGVRIELGEVEAALLQHEAIREVVVAARDDGGEKSLVAYVVTDQVESVNSGELRAFIKEKVPEYLVPSAFVLLTSLPLLPNGKIDRHALPPPDNYRPDLDTPCVEPANGLERTIADIWQEVLGLKQVGVNDNFFDLGGHSLLMAQVHRKLREELRIELPMIELLKYPTVGSLSRRLGGYAHETCSAGKVAPLFEKLSAGQVRLKQLRQGQRGI